jgi:hypothetical protein
VTLPAELAAVAEGSKSSSAAAWMSRLFASAPHSLSTQQMAHFSLHSANELALGMMGTQRGSHPVSKIPAAPAPVPWTPSRSPSPMGYPWAVLSFGLPSFISPTAPPSRRPALLHRLQQLRGRGQLQLPAGESARLRNRCPHRRHSL